jgi:glycosyltransferase involved in cell wall biosynthesis
MLKLFFHLRKIKPDIIHAHLFNAGRVTLPLAKILGIKSIYTRHYSTLNHDFYPSAVLQDKFMNALSDKIVSISEGVKSVLVNKEGVAENKVCVIPHGFNFNDIHAPSVTEKKKAREKLGIHPNRHPVIGVISRMVEWKGIQYIIPAFRNFLRNHPDALLLLANANGDYYDEIKQLATDIPSNNLAYVSFEKDQNTLYHAFDCFIHVPTDTEIEAFGQVYIEASAYGLPCIFTKSGIANEMAVDNINCIVVPHKNADSIFDGLTKIFTEEKTRLSLGINARNTALEHYQVKNMVDKHILLYNE